jgi:hypothetical protein
VFAVVTGCLSRSGIRAAIYRTAQQCDGLHTADVSEGSFTYNGEDLHVCVAFDEVAKARRFQGLLCDLQIGLLMPGVKCSIKMEKSLGSLEGFDPIWAIEYNPDDSTSPSQSMLEVASDAASVVSFSSKLAQFQSIENPRAWSTTRPEKLHLISKKVCDTDAVYDKYKTSDDNLISASRLFHEFFDGMNNDHEMIIMSMGWVGDSEGVPGGGSRVRVSVTLTFLEETVRDVMVPRLQVCAKVVNLQRRQYEVTLLVSDPKAFAFCVNWKMKNTICNLQKKQEDGKYIGEDYNFVDFLTSTEEDLSVMDELDKLAME